MSNNNSFPENTRIPLRVTPLNSVPYTGPVTHASMSSNNTRHPLQATPLNIVPYIGPETHASMSSNNSFPENTRHPLQVTPLNSVPYIAPETHASMSSNNSFPENTRNPLQVPPLNSVPYIGPETQASMSSNRTNENAENVGRPAMIFLPFQSTQEFSNLFPQTNTGIGLTGSAAMGRFGPSVGMVDIAESDDSYYFRVALPGVSKDESKLSCEIKNSGKVLIMGVTTTGEKTVCIHNQVFNMLTQNFCPRGPFTISFQLPGPVNNQEFKGNFGTDGVLEGIVKKLY